MSANDPLLLVVDYNLTRVADVARIARHARSRYNAGTILIRAQPGARDREIADYVVDLDPLAHGFIATALDRLAPLSDVFVRAWFSPITQCSAARNCWSS